MKKMYWIIIIIFGVLIVTGAIFATFVVQIENKQCQENSKRKNTEHLESNKSKTLVVYFSRSGNTELVALQIAKKFKAEIVKLVAEDYEIGFFGWLNSLKDARSHIANIKPDKIELSQFDTIFIGSPIWLYSPAPPVWTFAEKNDFTNKKVVLFNTYNSNFGQNYIDEFKSIIEKNGGTFLKHIAILRGRMLQQISTDELYDKINSELEKL